MDQEKIAKLIKTIREENNLTQKDLGDSLGVSAQAVSKWENGKNIPDIALLKEISDKYHIDINNLLDGENIKAVPIRNPKSLFVFPLLIGILILTLILLFNKGDFNSLGLSSSCQEFKLQGIISYNSNKSAISISKIEYCGDKNDEIYDNISCTLYETNKDGNKVVTTCDSKENIKLEEFLNNLSFNITNYEQSCKKYDDGVLRLEIVVNKNNTDEKFIVPLKLDEKC